MEFISFEKLSLENQNWSYSLGNRVICSYGCRLRKCNIEVLGHRLILTMSQSQKSLGRPFSSLHFVFFFFFFHFLFFSSLIRVLYSLLEKSITWTTMKTLNFLSTLQASFTLFSAGYIIRLIIPTNRSPLLFFFFYFYLTYFSITHFVASDSYILLSMVMIFFLTPQALPTDFCFDFYTSIFFIFSFHCGIITCSELTSRSNFTLYLSTADS